MTSANSLNSISLDATVLASPQQVSCNVADEAVLLSMRDGQYYGLNDVAASIWSLIQQPRTVGEVRDALLDQYDGIDLADCERAVVKFLDEMIALQLVSLL